MDRWRGDGCDPLSLAAIAVASRDFVKDSIELVATVPLMTLSDSSGVAHADA
jgi:hypothetical protein